MARARAAFRTYLIGQSEINLSASQKPSGKTKISIEIVIGDDSPITWIDTHVRVHEAELQYCLNAAAGADNRTVPSRGTRLNRIRSFTLGVSILLIVLLVGALALAIWEKPLSSIGAAVILASTFAVCMRTLGRFERREASGSPLG